MADFCSLDFETGSDIDLTKVGVYRYVESPHTHISRLGYAFNDEPVQLWRRSEPPPARVIEHAKAGGEFRAWNMQFERTMWNGVLHAKQGWPKLHLEQAFCTQAQALVQGLPAGLDHAAEALGVLIRVDPGKRRRMLKFCKPRLVNVDGSIIWHDDPAEAALFDKDCMVDVEIERAIGARLRTIPDREREIYMLDQRINDRGVAIDAELVEAGLAVINEVGKNLDADMKAITGGMVGNTRKRTELLNWLWLHSDLDEVETIDKHALATLLKRDDLDDVTRVVLTIRREAAKSSTAKLVKMKSAAGRDHRMRGTLQYYGARQTGRFAGRLIQPQNFPRGHVKPKQLEGVVADVKTRNVPMLDLIHGPPLDVISSLLRGCLCAGPGKELLVGDFSAIEARVLAWLADERPLLHAFRENIDPYVLMAAQIYDVDPMAVTPDQRQLGKMVVLAAGFQLGGKTFRNRLALSNIDVARDFADHIIATYRQANPAIHGFWYDINEAAQLAVTNPGTVYANGKLAFGVKRGALLMKLPNGRFLSYLRPTVESVTTIDEDTGEPWTRNQIFYWGVDPVTYRWARLYTYGGKLTENAVQAIARDLLTEAMLRVDAAGYPIVLHVHDEIVSEVPRGTGDLAAYLALMSEVPEWCPGLPIKSAGWRGPRYRKD